MLICVPEVLSKAEVAHCRRVMSNAAWEDGKASAGSQAARIKDNMQLPQDSTTSRELADLVLEALWRNALFVSAALPFRILPPMFSRYGTGQSFGVHVDNAIRGIPGTGVRMRTDLSCTLFLAEPDEYEGGELTVETRYGAQEVKLPAGDLVLYPSTSLHRVAPIAQGHRHVSFFWVQSMIREDSDRALLFELDQTIQELGVERGIDDDACVRLTGIYHNLIRRMAEV